MALVTIVFMGFINQLSYLGGPTLYIWPSFPIYEPMDFHSTPTCFTARQVALMDIGSSPEAFGKARGDLQTFFLMAISKKNVLMGLV